MRFKQIEYRGFTLIEIIVVVGIVALLASVVVVSGNAARENARDKIRISDLEQIKVALRLYAIENGTYLVNGAGYTGNGQGFYSLESDAALYPLSIARGLYEAGLIGGIVTDPLVEAPLGLSSSGHATYMVYPPTGGYVTGVCIFAELENPTQAHRDTITNAPIVDDLRNIVIADPYEMNYATCL